MTMMSLEERREVLRKVALVVFDFDGVMTDNRVFIDENGREAVVCSRGDGMGISLLRAAGVPMLIFSTEVNRVVATRAAKLRLECVHGLADKGAALAALLAERNVDPATVAYVGNDVNDRECLRLVGVPICVGDAHPSVLPLARLITAQPGGRGAVREVCDWILDALEAR